MRYTILDYRVIDGDTIEATLELGLGIQYVSPIRLFGVDAPESRTHDKEEKAAGLRSKNKLIEFMESAEMLACESVEHGRYGRILGYIFADGINLNQRMIDEHYAQVY